MRRGRQREGDRQRQGSRSKGMVNRSSPAEGLCRLIGSDSSERREGRFIYNLQYSSCDISSLLVMKRSPLEDGSSPVFLGGIYVWVLHCWRGV